MSNRMLVIALITTGVLCAFLSPAYAQENTPAAGQEPPAAGQEPPAAAQEETPEVAPVETPTVFLAAQQVLPGTQAYVTVMATGVQALDLTKLEQWIEFPKDKLVFVSARSAIAADLAEAEVKSDLETKDQTGILHIVVQGKRPIPDGPVAEVTFNVPNSVAEQIVVLKHKADGSGTDGKKLTELVVQGGEVKISKIPAEKPPAIMSCFFYMH
jgi:hypothetical protein